MTINRKWQVEIKGEFEIEHHAQDFRDYLENVLDGQQVDYQIEEVKYQ